MENNLEFLDTMTIEQFKDVAKVNEIKIKPSVKEYDAEGKPVYYTAAEIKAKVGKAFFAAGNIIGAIARNGIPAHPMISRVKGNPTEKNPSGEFYLMHEESTGGAPVLATF